MVHPPHEQCPPLPSWIPAWILFFHVACRTISFTLNGLEGSQIGTVLLIITVGWWQLCSGYLPGRPHYVYILS